MDKLFLLYADFAQPCMYLFMYVRGQRPINTLISVDMSLKEHAVVDNPEDMAHF